MVYVLWTHKIITGPIKDNSRHKTCNADDGGLFGEAGCDPTKTSNNLPEKVKKENARIYWKNKSSIQGG